MNTTLQTARDEIRPLIAKIIRLHGGTQSAADALWATDPYLNACRLLLCRIDEYECARPRSVRRLVKLVVALVSARAFAGKSIRYQQTEGAP